MSLPGYPAIERDPNPQRIADAINRLNQGKANTIIEVTLTANAASTTVTDARLHYFQGVAFDPMTANAAAELAAGTLYATQANRLNGEWVLTHANNAQTDRTFRMILSG